MHASCQLWAVPQTEVDCLGEPRYHAPLTMRKVSDLACVQGYMNLLEFFAVYGTLCKETGTPFR